MHRDMLFYRHKEKILPSRSSQAAAYKLGRGKYHQLVFAWMSFPLLPIKYIFSHVPKKWMPRKQFKLVNESSSNLQKRRLPNDRTQERKEMTPDWAVFFQSGVISFYLFYTISPPPAGGCFLCFADFPRGRLFLQEKHCNIFISIV